MDNIQPLMTKTLTTSSSSSPPPPPTSISKVATSGCCAKPTITTNNNSAPTPQPLRTRRVSCVDNNDDDRNNCNDSNQPETTLVDVVSNHHHQHHHQHQNNIPNNISYKTKSNDAEDKLMGSDQVLMVESSEKNLLIDRVSAVVVVAASAKDIENTTTSGAVVDNHHHLGDHHNHHHNDDGGGGHEESDCETEDTLVVRDEASGCVHYKRKAKFVTPCCGKFYKCRYCHDENEEHHFDRKTLTELICTQCDTRQKVQADCENCGVRFGKYTCLICNLFDDEDKDQYHCHGCGICRLGGRSNFFHCEVCNMCLPMQLRTDGHKCVENISRSNCPVCLGDIHTSRIPCHIPDCGHLLHKTCFDQLLASGHYVCPTCQTSMIDMKKLWDYLDEQALHIPVPKSYQNSSVNIFCNDCFKQSTVKFHFVGLKCGNCGGYNTSQNIQKRTWTNSKDNPSTSA